MGLSDIEAGISKGRASTRHKIARALEVELEELEGPTPGEAKLLDQQSGKADLIVELIALLPTLNEDELRFILNYAAGTSPSGLADISKLLKNS